MSRDLEVWQVVGRLIKDSCALLSLGRRPVAVEDPPIGALVVEVTHAWAERRSWPLRESVGWVERIDHDEDGTRRVVLRLMFPGDGEPLQPWTDASFYVADPDYRRRSGRRDAIARTTPPSVPEAELPPPCLAADWYRGNDGDVVILATCDRPDGHIPPHRGQGREWTYDAPVPT